MATQLTRGRSRRPLIAADDNVVVDSSDDDAERHFRWSNPGGGWGVVVLYTASGENGQVWQAVAVPVGFIGGD